MTSEPLLDIRFVSNPQIDLNGVQALLFTSANGVRAFAAAEGRRDLPAFAVGEATAAAARDAGFTHVESAAGRVEDLARLVRERLSPAGGPLLHAAGRDVAGDLSGALAEAGFEVRRAALYTAEAAQTLSPATVRALKAGEIDAVIFYSARTAETFRRLVDQHGLAFSLNRTAALGLSPAALEPLQSLPWGRLEAAQRPDESDLLRLLSEPASGPSRPADKPQPQRARRGFWWLLRRRAVANPPIPPAGSRFLVPLVWLAVLLSLGTFFLQTTQTHQSAPDLSPAASLRLTTIERRVDALARNQAKAAAPDPQIAAQLKALGDRIDALAARPAPAPTNAADVSALDQKLGAVEAKLSSAQSDREALADQVAALRQKVAAGPAADQLTALVDQNKRLSDQVADLQKQLAALQAAHEQGAARAGVLLAAGQVTMAAASGHPVAPALATLRALAGDDARLAGAIAELAPVADRPVPSVDALAQRFPAVATAALQAARREGAPPAAGSAETVGAWWNDIVRRLSSAVTIRRVGDVAGDTAEARIARAEQHLGAHDLAGAVDNLSRLTGAPANVAAGWLADARARLSLDKAVADLSAAAIAASGSPP